MTFRAFNIPLSFEVRYVDKPSGCERPHTHSSLIVSTVSGGSLCLQINEDEIVLQKEMVAAVGPNMLHSVRDYSGDFDGVYVLELFKSPERCNTFGPIHFQVFKSRLWRGKELHLGFIRLCQNLLSSTSDSHKNIFLTRWVCHYLAVQNDAGADGMAGDWEIADRIQAMLKAYEGGSPPFEEISATIGLSKERCNRIFRRVYNISIQAYYLNEKAAHARTLLATRRPLTDIALECGFYDQSHFTRVFKEIYQISPARYRALISERCQSRTINNG